MKQKTCSDVINSDTPFLSVHVHLSIFSLGFLPSSACQPLFRLDNQVRLVNEYLILRLASRRIHL